MRFGKQIFISISILFSIIGCAESDKKLNDQETSKNLKQWKTDVIKYGDIDSYNELLNWYSEGHSGEFLTYALVMGNRYNYAPAYYDAYNELNEIHTINGILENEIDTVTRNQMIDLLTKAVKGGVHQAQGNLDDLLKK